MLAEKYFQARKDLRVHLRKFNKDDMLNLLELMTDDDFNRIGRCLLLILDYESCGDECNKTVERVLKRYVACFDEICRETIDQQRG